MPVTTQNLALKCVSPYRIIFREKHVTNKSHCLALHCSLCYYKVFYNKIR